MILLIVLGALLPLGPGGVELEVEALHANGSSEGAWALGEEGFLHVTVRSYENVTVVLDLESDPPSHVTFLEERKNATLPAGGVVVWRIPFHVESIEREPRILVLLWVTNSTETFEKRVEVALRVSSPPQGLAPTLLVVLGGVALVVLGGVGAYSWSRRKIKVAPRSRALREMAAESRGRVETLEEIRKVERERERRRESALLEARLADARRALERIEERRARGEITDFQYRTLKAQREEEIRRIEEERRREGD